MQIRGRCSLALLMFIHEMKRRAKVAGNLPADRTGNNSVAVRNILSALNPNGGTSRSGPRPCHRGQLLPVRQGKDALRE